MRACRGTSLGIAVGLAMTVFGCDRPAPPSGPKAVVVVPAEVPEPLRGAYARARGDRFSATSRWACSADGTYLVLWEPAGGSIPDAEPFEVLIGVARADGARLADGATVSFDAEMPHHGHGMNFTPLVERQPGEGAFIAKGALLHMPGRWVIAVDVSEGGVMERTQWYVDIE